MTVNLKMVYPCQFSINGSVFNQINITMTLQAQQKVILIKLTYKTNGYGKYSITAKVESLNKI